MKNALDKLKMSSGIFDIGLSPDDCENILIYIKKLKEENKKLKEENKKLKEVQCTFCGTGCLEMREKLERIKNL